MKKRWSRDEKELGLDCRITRRDFLGTTLVGSGAALVGMNAPACRSTEQEPSPPSPELLGSDWTGPGGVGDYARSNGNPPCREVVQKGYGRITFGHSELTGVQAWSNGIAEGGRAAREAIARAT